MMPGGTMEPIPSISESRVERGNSQPPPASSAATAQVSPLPTPMARSESSDLILPGHPDA